MDVQIDCGAIYFGLKQIKNIESELSAFSSAMSGITLPGELTTASLLTAAKSTVQSMLNGDIKELSEIFEESKNILTKNDNHAALLFQFYEQGIIDEDGNFTDVPLLTQDDYSYIPYSQGTVATSGCGITSLCMVASYLMGDLYTPEDLAAIANANKHSNVGKMQTAADYVGLNWSVDSNTSRTDLVNYLKDGKLVICLVKGSSHFVVCKGLTEDGKILVNDPYRSYRSAAYEDGYTWDELQFSVGKTWVFDPAANTNAKTSIGTVSVDSNIVKKLQSISVDGNYTVTVKADPKEEKKYNPEEYSSDEQKYIPNLLGVSCLSQTDSRWANYTMTAGNTVNDSGCGYTSLAMILSGLKQEEVNPQELAQTLKAEVDTNNDGRADGFFDLNQDGKADYYDALSKSRNGNDGLNLNAVVSEEFAKMYDVKVENIHVGSDGDKYGIQDAMDDGKPCLIGTPSHYVVAVPGNNEYVDASGQTHRTTVLIDPYFHENTVEISGDFNYDNLAKAGVTNLLPQEMSVHTIENTSGNIPIMDKTDTTTQVVQLNNQTTQNTEKQEQVQQPTITTTQTTQTTTKPTITTTNNQTTQWQNSLTSTNTGTQKYYPTTSTSSNSTSSSSNSSSSASSNNATQTTPNVNTPTTETTPENTITNTTTKDETIVENNKIEVEKPTTKPSTNEGTTNNNVIQKPEINKQVVDHSTSTDEKVLEQLIPTIEKTTPDNQEMQDTKEPTINNNHQNDYSNTEEIPDTKVDKVIKKNNKTPIINPAFIGAAIATLSVGAVTVSEVERKNKKKDS